MNPAIQAALRVADTKVFGATQDWSDKANMASLVNYASAPLGAKKYEGSSLSR